MEEDNRERGECDEEFKTQDWLKGITEERGQRKKRVDSCNMSLNMFTSYYSTPRLVMLLNKIPMPSSRALSL